jgi:hypothetical protein
VGLTREELWSLEHVVPGVRFAVDAYVNFARQQPWQEAVCASLTELFAPQIHRERLAGWPTHYPWIDASGLQYFRSRLPLATRDVEHGLKVTLGYFLTRQAQLRALEILQFKLDLLWSMLDAIQLRYGSTMDNPGPMDRAVLSTYRTAVSLSVGSGAECLRAAVSGGHGAAQRCGRGDPAPLRWQAVGRADHRRPARAFQSDAIDADVEAFLRSATSDGWVEWRDG